MFPSGSRHSNDVKGGVALIAKMAKVRIMPVTYTGPMTLKGLVSRERVDMNFGNPIDISDIKKMNDEGLKWLQTVSKQNSNVWTKKPSNGTMIKTKPTLVVCPNPTLILAVIVGILTIIFTFIASFIWNPDKKREALG